MKPNNHKATDLIFHIGLIVKGVDSVFEVIGGLLLMFPMKLMRALLVLSQHEVYRHHENLAGRINNLSDAIETHASFGEASYLFIHGLAKVILIVAIFRGAKWGYLGLIGVLTLFALIEVTRALGAHEVLTGVLGLFDIVMVVLILKEFRYRFPKST